MDPDSAEQLGWQQLAPPYVRVPHSHGWTLVTLASLTPVFKSVRAVWWGIGSPGLSLSLPQILLIIEDMLG